ncbi:hypothetical protein [Longimicrobium terrae]|uniref:Tetratricopeptide repeat protein n=1 Tax=Longimicrobium terrae TaxID=1639882 RepID=A0A841GS68_9BACT|nr:hypothetical protein [Longimicrobium terrae]MBB4635676.1 hypothetical protein [Longimicrobium terrae]MBB6070070.1 hypothetical protein [Longimicrobium terrae]NNC32974.1 hypothetical protein [Longimicrobium terrae]
MNIELTIRRAALLAALAPLLLGGCVTASKRMDQGQRLEERGQSVDAAQRYIDALRRDPSLADARIRVQETGARAVDQLLARSEAALSAGDAGEAADLLLRLDALRRDAAAVNVPLAAPADYAQHRRSTLDAAIEASLDRGEQYAGSGRWSDALGGLDRAVSRWQPSAQQRARIDEARLATYLAWGEREAQAGRYRAAYDVTDRAVRLLGRDYAGMDRALELQARVLEEGTVRVAVLPLSLAPGMEGAIEADWLTEVDDELEDAPARAPMFVRMIDPREVRREVRRRGSSRTPLSGYEAAGIGRALEADVVVRMEVDSVWMDSSDVRTERRAAKLRTGADTAYTVASGQRQTRVRVRYTLVDVPSRRELSADDFSARASNRFREPRFAGNWRQLLLSRDEQTLFDNASRNPGLGERNEELTRGVVERFASEVMERVSRLVD